MYMQRYWRSKGAAPPWQTCRWLHLLQAAGLRHPQPRLHPPPPAAAQKPHEREIYMYALLCRTALPLGSVMLHPAARCSIPYI